MDGAKPDKCFTCGCTKFCWTHEKGWACLRCDPPSLGILRLAKKQYQREVLDLTGAGEEKDF